MRKGPSLAAAAALVGTLAVAGCDSSDLDPYDYKGDYSALAIKKCMNERPDASGFTSRESEEHVRLNLCGEGRRRVHAAIICTADNSPCARGLVEGTQGDKDPSNDIDLETAKVFTLAAEVHTEAEIIQRTTPDGLTGFNPGFRTFEMDGENSYGTVCGDICEPIPESQQQTGN